MHVVAVDIVDEDRVLLDDGSILLVMLWRDGDGSLKDGSFG